MTSAKSNGFYVGYLPLPASHARFLGVVLPAALLAAAGMTAWVATVQRDPGAAEWRTETETFHGTLLVDPYPLIMQEDGNVVLLVEQGKHGAMGRAAALAGRQVNAEGFVLTRDGRIVLELSDGPHALVGTGGGAPLAVSAAVGTVTLVGEIIDSKCYHGAMKPGEGKTHKACATLCISNGIPAMFIDRSGAAYLFTTGTPVLDDDTLSKVGERVEVTGEITVLGRARVLRAAAGGVRRVTPP